MISQQEIAEHLGLNQPQVSVMLKELGIDKSRSSMNEIRLKYIKHLRNKASGRGHDLNEENIRYTYERANNVALKNELARREVVRVEVLQSILANLSAKQVGIFDAIVPNIKRRFPHVDYELLDGISVSIIEARNLASEIKMDEEKIFGFIGDSEGDSVGAEHPEGAFTSEPLEVD